MRSVFALVFPVTIGCLLGCGNAQPGSEPVASSKQAIINGVPDNDGSAHEAVVLVFMDMGGGEYGTCSAALVAPNLILTAHHCVAENLTEGADCDPYGKTTTGPHLAKDVTPSALQIYNGFYPDTWMNGPIAKGAQIFHEESENLCNNDVALVVLDTNIQGITPLKLRLNFGAQVGENTMAIGYGKTDENNEFSAGKRYRRADIPVVTSGMDFNFWCPNNEFMLGESTAQGDSGGPVLSMSSGAIIGVTSRGTGDTHFYSRLDKHAALIQKAFTAAGATPQLEGATPPTNSKKAVGDGPCVAGSQCSSALCLIGPDSYCTDYCVGSGQCPINTMCIASPIQMFGQTPNMTLCIKPSHGTDCENCRYTSCKEQIENCEPVTPPGCSNADCLKYECDEALKCVDACTSEKCLADCLASRSAPAKEAYEAVRSCACSDACASVCANQCGTALPDDAGGSAGSPGTGGSSGSPGTAGTAGSSGSPGTDGTAGAAAGSGGSSGSSAAAGSGGASTNGTSAGAAGATATVPTSPSDDGGCSLSGRTSSSSGLLLLAWASIGLVRRRRAR